jgi:hypothetical protein
MAQQQQYQNKTQAREEFKVIGDVAEDVIKKGAKLTFQVGVTVITNGRYVTKKAVMKAFASLDGIMANMPEDWLFQPQIMVQSADVAGSDMQDALMARQKAKAALVKPSGLLDAKGKKVG